MESPSQSAYGSAYRNLQAAMETRAIGPENTEEIYRLVKPLESEIAGLPACPPGENDVDRITRLLWIKAHPERAEWPFVIAGLRDRNVIVRLIAVDVLRKVLPVSATESATQFVFRAQQVVQEQLRSETSPVLTYLLDQSANAVQRVLARTHVEPVVAETDPINPYVTGLPIRDPKAFFGRAGLLRELRSYYLSAGLRGIVLYGGRRTGKTSLLFHIERGALGAEFAPVWIDLQATAGSSDLCPVVLRAMSRRWPHLANARPQADMSNADRLEQMVAGILEAEPGRNLLLMVDEADLLDGFLTDDTAVARMLSLFETHPRLRALYARSQSLDKVGNPRVLTLLGDCESLKMGVLDRADALDMIRRPAEPTLAFGDEAVEQLLQLFGAHPFYTQLACRSVFSEKGGRGLVTADDVEAVVREFLTSPPPHLLLAWSGLGPDEQLVASALAGIATAAAGAGADEVIGWLRSQQYPVALSTPAVQQALAALRRADIICRRDEGSPQHVFTMEFVRRWIAHNQTIWDLLEKRTADVLMRSGSLKQRLLATAVDWAVAAAVVTLSTVLLTPAMAVVFLLVYYAAFLVVSDRTAGMRLLRLRAVNRGGSQLAWWRALVLGWLLAAEFVALIGGAGLVLVGSAAERGFGLLLLAMVTLQQVRVVVNDHRRGFVEKFAGAVLTRE